MLLIVHFHQNKTLTIKTGEETISIILLLVNQKISKRHSDFRILNVMEIKTENIELITLQVFQKELKNMTSLVGDYYPMPERNINFKYILSIFILFIHLF